MTPPAGIDEGDVVRWPDWKLERQRLTRRCRKWTVRGKVDGLLIVRRLAAKSESVATNHGNARWVYEVWREWTWLHWKDQEDLL